LGGGEQKEDQETEVTIIETADGRRILMAVSLALVLMVALSASPAAHATGLAIDGSGKNRKASVTSLTVTLTTTSSPDVIYLIVAEELTGVTVSSVTDSKSLTWTARASATSTKPELFTYWAVASSPLSSDTITVKMSGSGNLDLFVFGISGADTSSPFDPNAAVPASAHGSSTSPSVLISTTGTDDMLIGALAAANNPTVTAGSGFTKVSANDNYPVAAAEYKLVSSAQSNTAVSYTLGTSENWNIIADAVVAPGAIPDLPAGVLLLAAPVVTLYLLARKLRAREGMGGAESARTAHARRSVRRGVAG
jgi:hypothetical protein